MPIIFITREAVEAAVRRRLQQGSSGQGLARLVQEVQGQVFTSLGRAVQGVQGDTQVKGAWRRASRGQVVLIQALTAGLREAIRREVEERMGGAR